MAKYNFDTTPEIDEALTFAAQEHLQGTGISLTNEEMFAKILEDVMWVYVSHLRTKKHNDFAKLYDAADGSVKSQIDNLLKGAK